MLEYYEMCLVICQCYTYIINTVCNSYLHDIHTISVCLFIHAVIVDKASSQWSREQWPGNSALALPLDGASKGTRANSSDNSASSRNISLSVSYGDLSIITDSPAFTSMFDEEGGGLRTVCIVCMYVCVCACACYIHIQQSSHACTYTYVCMYKSMCVLYTYILYIHT